MFPKRIILGDAQVIVEANDIYVRTELLVAVAVSVGTAQVNAFFPLTQAQVRELAKLLNEAADEAEKEDAEADKSPEKSPETPAIGYRR